MKSFLAGLGIGIGLGIIFAPMSGEETRSNLQQRAGDLKDSALDLVDQGKDRVRTTVSAIRGQAERFGSQAADTVQSATGTETRNP
jgi:gas vesicle protein